MSTNGSPAAERELQIKSTHFRINKLPAMAAWAVLEDIREQLGRTVSTNGDAVAAIGKSMVDGDGAGAQIASILRLILGLPAPFVNDIRHRLFNEIQYKNKMAVNWDALSGSEDTAFAELDPGDIYKVLWRALSVNFTDSFLGLSGPNLPDPPNLKS